MVLVSEGKVHRTREFLRKVKAVMGVGLIRSTQSAGKPHTRGRDEQNVSH